MRITPSILAADLADLSSVVSACEECSCDMIHFDVMDGHFVPNLTFGPPLVQAARQYTTLPFDVHLMVTNPEQYIDSLRDLDIEYLGFHIEATRFAPRLMARIRDAGMRPSIAVNPQTSLTALESVLPLVDNVLLMSVDPGFAGQSFISGTFDKIEKLVGYREDHELVFTVMVDGGVNTGNVQELSSVGVDIVVAGKAFFTADDPAEFVRLVHNSTGN